MGKKDDELAYPEYWNARYEKKDEDTSEAYDWYRNWEQLGPWFSSRLPDPHAKILHLGCGNSTLTADLHALGFTNQTNIDFSEVVIKAMKAKYKWLNARWKVIDVRKVKFEDQSFDLVIDKGTMSCMVHGSVWDPPADVKANIEKCLNEVERVLAPGGTFIHITSDQPRFLKPLLAREKVWSLEVEVLTDPAEGANFEYSAYILTKKG